MGGRSIGDCHDTWRGRFPLSVRGGKAEREISLDETLIAQDAMEQMKASVRLGEPVSMPKEIVRNGRTYTVDMTEEPVYVESVPMRRMKAEVSDSSGKSVSFSVLMEDPQ